MFNSSFYPTPKALAQKMVAKIKDIPEKILEPSAGKGDLIEAIREKFHYKYKSSEYYAIEIEPELQAILRDKKVKVLDSDFLAFAGTDKFNLIIANPPFDKGEHHLLKAINIMYSGQIIFLLNAETLKSPYTNTRKLLVSKLDELGAEIEYIQGAFQTAERPTGVEVALINIVIERQVEDDLFADCNDKAADFDGEVEESREVSVGKSISEMVAEYNQTIKIGTETIINYYRNYPKIWKYIGLNQEAGRYQKHTDLTPVMQNEVNNLLKSVRVNFWQKVLTLDDVTSRLTEARRSEFDQLLIEQSWMDFTENNIRQFVLNLIKGFDKTLMDAVLEIFDMFTRRHNYNGGPEEKNIHYFNGWKTNDAFKVGGKVVIPIYSGWGSPFIGWNGGWKLDTSAARTLHDIDLVMNYFNGLSSYFSMPQAIESAFEYGQSRKIHSTFFTITTYKKGTIHLTFNDSETLRRFNRAACIGKNWLPQDYGAKPYEALSLEEKSVVDSFEGKKSYEQTRMLPVFTNSLLQLAAA